MNITFPVRAILALLRFYLPAQQLVGIGRYADAKAKMVDYFSRFPGTLAFPEANILMGLICLRLGEYLASADYTTTAFDQLETGPWHYTETNKKYLQLYCSNLVRFVHTKAGDVSVDSRLEDPLLMQVDFGGVHSLIKKSFPMKNYEAQVRAYLAGR